MTMQESLDNAARAKAEVDALEGNIMSGRVEDLNDTEGVSGDEESRAEQEEPVKHERKVGEGKRANTMIKAEEDDKEEIIAQFKEQTIKEEEEGQEPADMAKEKKKKNKVI